MYLLDTNVVSELRKAKNAHRGVRTWAQALPVTSLFLSAISILELEIGVLLIERRDRKQGTVLRGWLDGHVLPAFSGRILPIAVHNPGHRTVRMVPGCSRLCYLIARMAALKAK